MSLTILAFVLIIIIALSLLWMFKTRRMFKLGSLIPTPEGVKSLPIIGHAHHFLSDTDSNFDKMFDFFDGPEPVYHIRFLHFMYVSIVRPEDYDIILNSPHCLEKGDVIFEVFKPIIGNGLFTCDVPTFKIHRKILLPTFNQKVLDGYIEIFVQKTNILISILENEVGNMFNIFDLVEQCNLDTVTEALTGMPMNNQITKDGFTELSNIMQICMQRTFNIFHYYNFIFNFTKLSKYMNSLVKPGIDLLDKTIRGKIDVYQSKKTYVKIEDELRKGFLDTFIELFEKGQCTYSEMKDELLNFIVAGSHTTAITNSFLMTMLALHPEIEQKVYDEVMEILGPDREVEPADINKFYYLEKVVKETMRLFPAAPMVVRKACEDIQLETCIIPKGAQLLLRFGTTQRNPKYYPDPLKFDPERFSNEETSKRHPYAFLTYSGGMRNCIGHRYATMFMKTQTAMLVRKYRFETAYKSIDDVEIRQNVVVKPLKGFKIKLIRRN